MNEKKKTGVIAIAALMAVLFFAIGSAQAVEEQRYFDNVEGGIAGWTEETLAGVPTDSLWHITETRANSPTHSWWYGQEATGNYDTGIANSGCLVSPVISLNGDATAATLEYWTWWQTETKSSYDLKKVYVRPLGAAAIGTLLETLPGGECLNAAGEVRTLDLSAYKGGDVQILFCFNTRDDKYNAFEGWFVDDIEVLVEVEGPTPPEGDLEVTKTVWNWKTEEWVDEILCAELGDELEFQCVIENIGDTNLTNVRFWDIMTCSLDFVDESAAMLVPGGMWTPIIEPEPNVFKQKLLHSIDYESGDPDRSSWKQIYPGDDVTYEINAWNDTNNDGNLTVCDQINVAASDGTWYHVDWVTYTLNTTNATGGTCYFDAMAEYDYANPEITDPEATQWYKVCPSGCPDLEWSFCTVDYWTDTNENNVLDSGDVLFMVCDDGTAGCHTLTEDVKPDIWVSKEWDVDELNGEWGAVILHPGENVTVTFEADVVAYGDDYNIQCAKAKNETGDWIYSNCDEVHIRAPEQRVYLSPVNSSSTYCNCAEVELRIDACDFKSGEVELNYDDDCVELWSFVNSTDFPMTEWCDSGWGWNLITFATDQQTLTGDYLIGTLSLHCEDVDGCTSDLYLDGGVFDPFGNYKWSVSFEGGSFECIESHICGDVNVDGLVSMGDVGDLHNTVTYGWGVADEWAGDVNCWDWLEMGDVGLLHNYVQYGDPPYALNCCLG